MNMRTVLMVYLLCFSVVLTAQQYIPLLQPENQWNELVRNISLPLQDQYERTYITKLGEIAKIDGVSCYELKTTKVETADVWETVGYIREDIELQTVYFRPLDKQEMLLYDFNVQAGDVLRSYDLRFSEPIEVAVTIDSVKNILIDSMVRKQIYVTSEGRLSNDDEIFYKNHVWIEGIGNLDGFLYSNSLPPVPGSQQYAMLCFFNNDRLVYKNTETGIDACFVWRYLYLGINEYTKTDDCVVWQIANRLLVSSKNQTIFKVEILDISGKRVYFQRNKFSKNECEIDLESIPYGLYLLNVHNVEGCSSFKIVKIN